MTERGKVSPGRARSGFAVPPRAGLEEGANLRKVPAPSSLSPAAVLAASMTEKEFMWSVIRRAERLLWRYYHPHRSKQSPAGYPDLTLVHHKLGIVFAELKREGEKPTVRQMDWLDELSAFASPTIGIYLWRPSDLDTIDRVLLHGPSIAQGWQRVR